MGVNLYIREAVGIVSERANGNEMNGVARATPGQPLSLKFVDFVGSNKGQEISGEYGKDKHGAPLYNAVQYAH